MIASATMTLGTVGFIARRRGLARCTAILLAATLWMVIDLDHPRRGMIRLDDTPLTSLRIRTPG